MKKFKPVVYQCTQCQGYMWSRYSGNWDDCECGCSYVDQTFHYTRLGGKAELVAPLSSFKQVKLDADEIRELWEEYKWRALDLMEAKIKRVEKVDVEAMEVYVEVELENCPEKVWWAEQEERYGE